MAELWQDPNNEDREVELLLTESIIGFGVLSRYSLEIGIFECLKLMENQGVTA
jgi:hypothetical protein